MVKKWMLAGSDYLAVPILQPSPQTTVISWEGWIMTLWE